MKLRIVNDEIDLAFAIKEYDKQIQRWEKAIETLPEGEYRDDAIVYLERDRIIRDKLQAAWDRQQEE